MTLPSLRLELIVKHVIDMIVENDEVEEIQLKKKKWDKSRKLDAYINKNYSRYYLITKAAMQFSIFILHRIMITIYLDFYVKKSS